MLPWQVKRVAAGSVDITLCFLATVLAFYLRLGEYTPIGRGQIIAFAVSLCFAIPAFALAGLYRAIFRYGDVTAITSTFKAMLVYAAVFSGLITFAGIDSVPRTVGVIQPVLLLVLVGSSRIVAGWWLGGSYRQHLRRGARQKVVIYGAGSAGRQLYNSLARSEMQVLAFVDDDPRKQGRTMLGRKVLNPDRIPNLIERNELGGILLAIPTANRRRRSEIMQQLRANSIPVRTVPGLVDLARGDVRFEELHELEIEDLLGRDAVKPNDALLRSRVTGKVVLVTGAGGSIGSEICRQIAALGPSTILLLELSEAALYSIHADLKQLNDRNGAGPVLVPLLGSTCDAPRMTALVEQWRPDTIYHAAAYKHVPLVEANIVQGVFNNVVGTLVLALAARDHGVADFVLISTDKAVRPTNAMGASKRLCELILQALSDEPSDTCFSMVRFGNVLGSSGSVVPLFKEQLRSGGPITITHPDMTRYFMTIAEAAELVIQAGAMAAGGEVFLLDMGRPVRIVDLARIMVEHSGLSLRDQSRPDGEIEIQYVGLRPGEKLNEELLIGGDPEQTGHPRIFKASESFIEWPILHSQLKDLESALSSDVTATVLSLLQMLVPEYRPDGEPAPDQPNIPVATH